ncbi:hypothetical protein Sjap_024544 [Stephania japonica]|uniref:Protein DA1-like domain-containing protein n=1 Tax=Stephania japonica TaxID=461633 RepID=A0AAP0EIE9_9MAGN
MFHELLNISFCSDASLLLIFEQNFSPFRLLTGSILAHEMMHAWLRLNEGIRQVLAHMWLDSMSASSRSGSSLQRRLKDLNLRRS